MTKKNVIACFAILLNFNNLLEYHSFLFGRRAEFDEVIKYADFSQEVALQEVNKLILPETSPSDDFIAELLSGTAVTENENVVELPTGKAS